MIEADELRLEGLSTPLISFNIEIKTSLRISQIA